jgi:broad specificity phosphatase PhoE
MFKQFNQSKQSIQLIKPIQPIQPIKPIQQIKSKHKINKIKEIYLIRHGQTEWNVLHKAQGSEHDIPLNDQGREQSKKTGNYLANYRLENGSFDLIVSSGMQRAHETAQIIAGIVGYIKPILIIEDFKERGHGTLGGKTDEELKLDPKFNKFIELNNLYDKEPDPIKQQSMIKSHNKILNQLYNTELISDLRYRLKRAIKEIYNRSEKKILIISHGGTILEIIRILTNIDDHIHGNYKYGANCHITYLKLYKKITNDKSKFKTKIIKLPNTLHLKEESKV